MKFTAASTCIEYETSLRVIALQCLRLVCRTCATLPALLQCFFFIAIPGTVHFDVKCVQAQHIPVHQTRLSYRGDSSMIMLDDKHAVFPRYKIFLNQILNSLQYVWSLCHIWSLISIRFKSSDKPSVIHSSETSVSCHRTSSSKSHYGLVWLTYYQQCKPKKILITFTQVVPWAQLSVKQTQRLPALRLVFHKANSFLFFFHWICLSYWLCRHSDVNLASLVIVLIFCWSKTFREKKTKPMMDMN